MLAPKLSKGRPGKIETVSGTNPAMNIRYSYNPQVFTQAPYDERREYPLQLDAQGWSLHGKRLAGLGIMLEGAPAPMLYDFVASQHAEMYEDWYKLERVMEEYEDARIQGRLAVHCRWRYNRTAETTELPYYLPDSVRNGDVLETEGWALFTKEDLFFFYTFSAEQLTDGQRSEVISVLESISFNALGLEGSGAPDQGRGRSPGDPEPEQP